MIDEPQELLETQCPRCGAEANWRFLDDESRVVEILCPDCGRFGVPGAEFEEAAIDSAQLNDQTG